MFDGAPPGYGYDVPLERDEKVVKLLSEGPSDTTRLRLPDPPRHTTVTRTTRLNFGFLKVTIGRRAQVRAGQGQVPGLPRSGTVDLTARLLPARDRERWAEEWAAEWQDMATASRRARWAFLARLLLRTGPMLAWVLRLQHRREAA